MLAPYSSTAGDLALEEALGRLVKDPSTGAYYAWLNGTSMAAPHATGVVALIRAAHPGMPVGSVVATLRKTATPQGCPSALDPGVDFFGAPVQVLQGRYRQQQLLRERPDQRPTGREVANSPIAAAAPSLGTAAATPPTRTAQGCGSTVWNPLMPSPRSMWRPR